MDLDEWVLLSDDELLDEMHDDGGRTIYGSNNPIDFITNSYSLSPSQKFSDPVPPANQIGDVLRTVQPEPMEEMGSEHVHDHDIVVNSHVSFKKMMRENEFVDMKMDSPENESSSSRIGRESDDDNDERNDGGRRLKIWKWGSTGIGAICSFGVAAATFCFIVYANVNGNHPTKKKIKNGGEKIMNRTCGDEKSINQEALSRANIPVGLF